MLPGFHCEIDRAEGLCRRLLLLLLLLLPIACLTFPATASRHPQESAPRFIQALSVEQEIVIDGRLDEPAWNHQAGAVGFIQAEPVEGQAATERTEVRILHDSLNLYVGVYCFDSDPDAILINEIVRDFDPMETDAFGLAVDAFHDRRNAFVFFTNAGGAKRDEQSFDDGRFLNTNWDGSWEVKSQLQPDGWSAEMRIPFRTLRFTDNEQLHFGLNLFRNIRRKNEQVYWSPIPRRFNLYRVSMAGQLKLASTVARGRNLRLKPALNFGLNQVTGPETEISSEGDVSADVKYSVSPSLTLDLAVNPNFSQVEVDTQQINLTRFDLFFPEKREFFLENEGFFHFGDIQGERGPNPEAETRLFHSRRIGLSESGQAIPLLGGARLSGRAGPFTMGLLNIQQRESGGIPATNFSVLRFRRDLFGQSDVGAIFVNRQSSLSGDYNRSYGVDSNFQFFENLRINTYVARTDTPSLRGENTRWKFGVEWRDNSRSAQFIFTDTGKNFNPEVGFILRRDVRHYRGSFSLLPRPGANPLIRQFRPHATLRYTTDRANRLLTRDDHWGFTFEFHDGSSFEIFSNRTFERLDRGFEIREGVLIPPGDYRFADWGIGYTANQSGRVGFNLNLRTGTFWSGRRTRAQMSAFLVQRPKLRASLSYTVNRVRLPQGNFDTKLPGLRLNYSLNPRTFFDAFLQYNSTTRKWINNFRFRLIHRPLSDLFVVFTEERSTARNGPTRRSIQIKYTYALEM